MIESTYAEVLPSTTLSVTSPAMKSSSEGPSASFLLNTDLDDDGVAKYRTCDKHLDALLLEDDAERKAE